MPAIDLEFLDLDFAYPGSSSELALRCATARFEAGDPVALVGPNGAGKSTLCKILNGVIRPDCGLILLGGRRVEPHRNPGRFVSYAYQNPNDQLFCDTVRRELEFGPRLAGLTPVEAARDADAALELFGLEGMVDAHPLDLPFSDRKRVSMAVACAMRCPWLIFDEPTVAQDPPSCERLKEIFASLAERGNGVILISHDPEFLFEVASSVAVIEKGRVAWRGDRAAYLAWGGADDAVNLAARTSRDLGLAPVTPTRADLVAAIHIHDARPPTSGGLCLPF